MVLVFGIRLFHPTEPISLSGKVTDLRFSFKRLFHLVHKRAFVNGDRGHAQPFIQVKPPSMVDNCKRIAWSIRSSADGSGMDPLTNSGDGRTRLIKTVQNLQIRINTRIRDLRRDLPRKFLFFLVGFYCATAFATVIGQTGDWDILSAALAVAVVEGIGALMYKASVPFLNRIRNLIIMFNYWKAGLTLGLFLDSFKY